MTAANPEITQLLQRAAEAQRAGRQADAAEAFERVLSLDPSNPIALNSLGLRALDAGDTATAVSLLGRAAAADPSATALWMNLAKAQRLAGDAAGEGASLDRALETNQRHFMALVRRAELHERLEEHAKATARWSGVLALAAGLDQRTPALEEMLGHARAYVGERMRLFEAAIAGPLDTARAGLDGAERRRFDAAIDHMLGKRAIYANECAGLLFPFLPADEFFERRHFPWFCALEAHTDAIRAELEALLDAGGEGFAPYVAQDPGTPVNKWTPLDNKLDWGACYLWKFGSRNEAAAERCPQTMAALDAVPLAMLPGRTPNAFFSVLQPKTRIPPHTGVSNTRAIIHLPLIVPEGCGFRVGGETREWRVGEAFAFDDTIDHEAWNESGERRAVLILDVWNPHLSEAERRLLQTFYAAADASGHNPEPRDAG